jgi:hypothetical protein
MTEWQPIGTAPRSSEAILTWDGDTAAVVIWCGCRQEWLLVERSRMRPAAESPSEWRFSHWMPLPSPPSGSAPTEPGERE